jgi:hypothetical protein
VPHAVPGGAYLKAVDPPLKMICFPNLALAKCVMTLQVATHASHQRYTDTGNSLARVLH